MPNPDGTPTLEERLEEQRRLLLGRRELPQQRGSFRVNPANGIPVERDVAPELLAARAAAALRAAAPRIGSFRAAAIDPTAAANPRLEAERVAADARRAAAPGRGSVRVVDPRVLSDQEELLRLQEELNQLQLRLDVAEAAVVAAEAVENAARGALAGVGATEAERDDLQQRLNDANVGLMAANVSRADLETRVRAIEVQRDGLQQQLDDANLAKGGLEVQADDLRSQNDLLQGQNDDLQADNEDLEDRLQRLGVTNAANEGHLREELLSVESQLLRLQNENVRLAAEATAAAARLAAVPAAPAGAPLAPVVPRAVLPPVAPPPAGVVPATSVDSLPDLEHRVFSKVQDLPLRKRLDDFAHELTKLGAKSTLAPTQVKKLIENSDLAELKAALIARPDLATDIVAFVTSMRSADGQVPETYASWVGLTRAKSNTESNKLEWAHDAQSNPERFLFQRLLLASSEEQAKTVALREQLRQQAPNKQYGLQKFYDDREVYVPDAKGKLSLSWQGLGARLEFEKKIYERYDEISGRNKRAGRKMSADTEEFFSVVSTNQFFNFARNAIAVEGVDVNLLVEAKRELDGFKVDSEMHSANMRGMIQQLNAVRQLIVDGALDPATLQRKTDLDTEIAALQPIINQTAGDVVTKELLIKKLMKPEKSAALAAVNVSDIEVDALFGPVAGSKVNRGQRYLDLFFRIVEDEGDVIGSVVNENMGFFDAALAERLAKKAPNNVEKTPVQKEERRQAIFSLGEEQLAIIISGMRTQSLVQLQSYQRRRSTEIAIPLKKINAARNEMKLMLAETPTWWETVEKMRLREDLAILKGGNPLDQVRQAKIDEVIGKYEVTTPDAAARPYDLAATPQQKQDALIKKYEDELKAIGTYQFKPLGLNPTDADLDLEPTSMDDSQSAFDVDNQIMTLQGIKGSKVDVYSTGLEVRVFEGNKGYSDHEGQFDAISRAAFTGKDPLCAISHLKDRQFGEGRKAVNEYCITSSSKFGSSKTFITPETFEKILKQSADEYKRYATHLAKVEAMKQMVTLLLVSSDDAMRKGEVGSAEVGASLAKKAHNIELLLKVFEILPTDNFEARESKLEQLNGKYFEERLVKKTERLNKLTAAFSASGATQKEANLIELNNWLAIEGRELAALDEAVTTDNLKFLEADSADEIARKKQAILDVIEANKLVVSRISLISPESEASPSVTERFKELKELMINGDKVSPDLAKKAQVFASNAMQVRLSNGVRKSQLDNHFKIKLDPKQIEKFVGLFGETDGHLWMSGNNKKDLTSLLSAPLPISTMPGITISKPTLGEKGAIRFKNDKKNFSNGDPNYAAITFTANEKGEFVGDDLAIIALPGTDYYVRVEVARQDGEGKTKGQVTIRDDIILRKDPITKKYEEISLGKNRFTSSDLKLTLGARDAEDVIKAMNNFSIVATSVCNGVRGSVAVMMNGTAKQTSAFPQRLSSYRDPSAPDRNLSVLFTLDTNGRIIEDSDIASVSPILGYGEHKIVARRSVEVRDFKKDDGWMHDFKIVSRIAAAKDANNKGLFIRDKDHLVIEIINPETGKVEHQVLTEDNLAALVAPDSDIDVVSLIHDAKDLTKRADIAISVQDHTGKIVHTVLESKEGSTGWFGFVKKDERTNLKPKGKKSDLADPSTVIHPVSVTEMINNRSRGSAAKAA